MAVEHTYKKTPTSSHSMGVTTAPQKDFQRDPLWYKDAIIYQLHVRGFYDSDGDGIGDFRGLIQKLDYLKELGVNAIWLQPFYPSPLKDDGYDIADYKHINTSYGDLGDFKAFLREAHDRGMRVITELVINHTSDQHEWFQKARKSPPGSYWRDFYVWSDDPQKYKEARIIFKDFELSNWSYDPVAKSYYWHRFYSHQPDLNFDNPNVKKRIFQLVDYWMKMGVDGMRLDAIPYLFEREGTSCENLPETHAFLKEMRAYLDERYPDRMLLAEANQWPEDAVAYFGEGDECHMCFHFPVMPRLFMAIKMEDRFSIIDILRQTPDIPENCQWAMFLRNHDELTLEMVTDEERDYMYNVYASDQRARINLGIRRRLAPLLSNDRRQIELLKGLLFSLPGTPIMYYGDEIGMGDNIYLGDRNGVRTPFQWSSDRNAGFSDADPQKLYLPVVMTPEYHYTTVNVENQINNQNSLLRWTKDLIEMRKENIAMTRGSVRFLYPENRKVLALIREYKGEDGQEQTILMLANLSKRAQFVELDLSEYRGRVPVELRGEAAFPSIGELPYFITLGPYDFYWFDLTRREKLDASQWLLRDSRLMRLPLKPKAMFDDPEICKDFEGHIRDYLPKARWFAGKGKTIRKVKITDAINIDHFESDNYSVLLFTEVSYREEPDNIETYLLTLSFSEGERAENILRERPDLVIGEYHPENNPKAKGIYHEAIIDAGFGKALLRAILRRKEMDSKSGKLTAETYTQIRREWLSHVPEPAFLTLEQSNSSLRFDKSFFFKLFRRLEEGENPEIEIGRHFSKTNLEHVPKLIGSLAYKKDNKSYSLAVLHEYREGVGSAWDHFLEQLENFKEAANAHSPVQANRIMVRCPNMFTLKRDVLPDWFIDETGYACSLMRLLGKRTAQMHKALGEEENENGFKPEAFTPFYQRSLYQSLRNRAEVCRRGLREKGLKISESDKALRKEFFEHWDKIEKQFDGVRTQFFGGSRIRIHGDYHLGQVLFTGKDFTMLDFEGEPMRSISTRRLKHSPLQDVAGMLRSINYLVLYYAKKELAKEEEGRRLLTWIKLWYLWMSHQFLEAYVEECEGSGLLPEKTEHIRYLTETFLIEKALYEINYEISSRPDWISIPVRGLLDLLPTLSSCNKGEQDE